MINHVKPRIAENGELRMYFIAMRHLSGIQKGIQSIHATAVYGNKFAKSDIWKKWSSIDHTVVLLEGNEYQKISPGGIMDIKKANPNNIGFFIHQLELFGIEHSVFHEPDFSNAFTSVGFILDERFFKSELYPDEILKPNVEDNFEFYDKISGLVGTNESLETIRDTGFSVGMIRNMLKTYRLASN